MKQVFQNPQSEFFYQELKNKYNRSVIFKSELANEMGCSLATIDLYMQKGIGLPNYKKLGNAKNSRVVFNLVDVAEFLTDTTLTA